LKGGEEREKHYSTISTSPALLITLSPLDMIHSPCSARFTNLSRRIKSHAQSLYMLTSIHDPLYPLHAPCSMPSLALLFYSHPLLSTSPALYIHTLFFI
jgi:hypothetical protein